MEVSTSSPAKREHITLCELPISADEEVSLFAVRNRSDYQKLQVVRTQVRSNPSLRRRRRRRRRRRPHRLWMAVAWQWVGLLGLPFPPSDALAAAIKD